MSDWLTICFDRNTVPIFFVPFEADADEVGKLNKSSSSERNAIFSDSAQIQQLSASSLFLTQRNDTRIAFALGVGLIVAGIIIVGCSLAASFFSGGGSLFGLFIADALFAAGLGLLAGVGISYSRNGVFPSFKLGCINGCADGVMPSANAASKLAK